MTSNKQAWLALKALVTTIYIFIMAPIIITLMVSFNDGERTSFPPTGLSLRWWEAALTHTWTDPLLLSVQLGVQAAIASTLIGTPLAFALVRKEFPGKKLVEMLTVGPLILPTLLTGVALLQFLTVLGMNELLGFWALLVGHVVICLPFSVRSVAIALRSLPSNIEYAAASLGASPWKIMKSVTLPTISGGMFAGVVFAFIHSFTDVNMSIFLAEPAETPVTVAILNFLEFGFSPTLAAVSMISLAIPLILITALQRFVPIGDFLYSEAKNAK